MPEVNILPWLSTEKAAVNAPSAGKQEVRKQNELKQCFSKGQPHQSDAGRQGEPALADTLLVG